jgi:hypothetical protein
VRGIVLYLSIVDCRVCMLNIVGEELKPRVLVVHYFAKSIQYE